METDPFATPNPTDDPDLTDDPFAPEAEPVVTGSPVNGEADPTAVEPEAPSPTVAQEAPSAPQETPDAPPAAQPAVAPVEPESEAGTPASEATEKPRAKRGSKPTVFRHYVVLLQTGPEQFTKVDLNGQDHTVEVEEEHGKATYLSARNNDHAYKLAYHLVGRPESGATLLPLPKASWRPRHVAPAPPAPERERLTIS